MSWRRRRKRRQQEAETRLAEDAGRVVGFLESVLVDAARLGVDVDEGVLACVLVLRGWTDRIRRSSPNR
jgi:hypothetical protein